MRFYDLDGIEEDIQDPRYFLDEEKIMDIKESIEEMLNFYV